MGQCVQGFDAATMHSTALPPIQHALSTTDTSLWIGSAVATLPSTLNPATAYMTVLTASPLPTKMVTGATLAVAGDAIAQSRQPLAYDQKRAVSFALFDMCYRALQHVAYPAIVNHCHGQYAATVASLLFSQYYLPLEFGAALERTLASQLGIVPFIYYPVFFALTAYIQGLGVEDGVSRAKDMFLPLLQRNLLFWIPVQMVQFSFVPEDLQIPFISVMGLFWTFLLSVMAGSTKKKDVPAGAETDETYCVIGSEEGCVVPEELFPPATLQKISEELTHEVQVVSDAISHELEEIAQIFDQDEADNDVVSGKDQAETEMTEEREEIFK